MIHEIGVELNSQLARVKCPLKVIDGPEPTKTASSARERIVIEPDDGGDAFGSVIATHKNPTHRMTRQVGVKVTIYVQSARPSAFPWEHRRRAEHILDLVLVGLDTVIRSRRNAWRQKSGKFITPPDLAGAEIPGFAVYELTFSVDRAVMSQDFAGNARPQQTIGGKPGASSPAGLSGTPTLTFAAAGETITRSAGSWVDDGFALSQRVRIRGTQKNNVLAHVAAVTDLVMTVGAGELANEGPVSDCSVTVAVSTTTTSVWFQGDDDPAHAETA